MAAPAPSVLKLWRANSLTELGEIAAEEGLRDALAQPIRGLWEEELGPDAAQAVSAVHGLKGSMSLGQLLADRYLHQEFRRLLAPAHRRELLRAARALLERPRPSARRPPAGPAAPPEVEDGPVAPRTYGELDAWATASGVPEAILAPVDVLCEFASPQLLAKVQTQGGPCLALDDLIAVDEYARSGSFRTGVAELRKLKPAAWRYLLACAADVRTGLAEESARAASPQPRPEHPVLAELQERLVEARTRVRDRAMPRSWHTVSKGRLTIHGEPPAFHFTEAGKLVVKDQWSRIEPRVTIGLDDWRTAPLSLSCTCRTKASAACTHALAAIDAVLQSLTAPAPEVATLVVETLTLPRWGRALRALAKVTRPETQTGPASRLTWRVRTEGTQGARITPFLQRETKKGGFTAGTKIGPDQIVRDGRERYSEADVRAAMLLGQRYPGDTVELTRQVLEQLVGHPHVFFDDRELSPLCVAQAELGI
ncbi:MAG: hypothetical protein ACYC8T_33465, partial [Myxococcaceae bacterium]